MAPRINARTKHIKCRYHWIRERIAEGDFVLHHVPSADNVADLLTKTLVKEKFAGLLHGFME